MEKNSEVKRAQLGVVPGWVTFLESLPTSMKHQRLELDGGKCYRQVLAMSLVATDVDINLRPTYFYKAAQGPPFPPFFPLHTLTSTSSIPYYFRRPTRVCGQ
ncbi:hypothetical protein Taro_009593, partial [Colocasia esculenta]|nr:hypothetical protein [Colocasia esculenta]